MKAEIIDYLGREFATLETLFDSINNEAWFLQDQRLKGIWLWMTHVLETIQFYSNEKSVQDFTWGQDCLIINFK